MTIGLLGAGGFGKTHLATWACHQEEIVRRYPGGLLWVTLTQDEYGGNLAERINNLVFALCGRRPTISDPEVAGWELGRLLDEREPVLLVIDDVWNNSQLRPFLLGGRSCTRLVTTRISGLLSDEECVRVDAMSIVQARELMCDRVVGLPVKTADRLAVLAGRWPVLLNLVNGVLRRRIAQGQPSQQAAADILRRLTAEGPAAFDPIRPGDRSQAVAATVDASMALLSEADQDRFLDLAIFPEDVDIPLNALELLWPGNRVDALCQELVTLGLAVDWRWNASGQRLILHDVIRSYLRTRNGVETRANAHQRLIGAAAELLHEYDETIPWWTLPDDRDYLWRYLPQHMHEAGLGDEIAALVCDLRWVEAKIRRFGSVMQVEADLSLVDDMTIELLRRILQQDESLFGPIDPPAALGATLASRLYAVPELRSLLDRYSAVLPKPLLEPVWPLADRSDPIGTAAAPGHIGGVTDCVFSPDGGLLASAGEDGTVRLWQVVDGVEQRVLRGHLGGVRGCVFSPDGGLLASAGEDGTVRLWQGANREQVILPTASADKVLSCAFSPDGAVLATTSYGMVRLWNVRTRVEQAAITGHVSAVWACAFSPDGALLATASIDQTVRLWRVADGAEHAVLTRHTYRMDGCAFSPDGTLLATAAVDGAARICRIPDGTEFAVLHGHASKLSSCAFSPDGTLLATASNDRTVRLWRVTDSAEQAVLDGHLDWVRGCAFSPDGELLATASADGTARLWRVADGAVAGVLNGHTGRVYACAFSPDGELLATAGTDGTARLWHVADGTQRAMLTNHTDLVNSCAFSPDGTLLATASDDRTARLWQVYDGVERTVLRGHTGWVDDCKFSPDGVLLATASGDATIRVWQVATGRCLCALRFAAPAIGITWHPDGIMLGVASGAGVNLLAYRS